jgi:hypothetical protein
MIKFLIMTTNDFSMQELQIGGGLDLIRGQSVNLDEAWALISTCSEWLRDIGMDHWDKYYTRKMVEEKIKGQELYLAYREGELVGTVRSEGRGDVCYGFGSLPRYAKTRDSREPNEVCRRIG